MKNQTLLLDDHVVPVNRFLLRKLRDNTGCSVPELRLLLNIPLTPSQSRCLARKHLPSQESFLGNLARWRYTEMAKSMLDAATSFRTAKQAFLFSDLNEELQIKALHKLLTYCSDYGMVKRVAFLASHLEEGFGIALRAWMSERHPGCRTLDPQIAEELGLPLWELRLHLRTELDVKKLHEIALLTDWPRKASTKLAGTRCRQQLKYLIASATEVQAAHDIFELASFDRSLSVLAAHKWSKLCTTPMDCSLAFQKVRLIPESQAEILEMWLAKCTTPTQLAELYAAGNLPACNPSNRDCRNSEERSKPLWKCFHSIELRVITKWVTLCTSFEEAQYGYTHGGHVFTETWFEKLCTLCTTLTQARYVARVVKGTSFEQRAIQLVLKMVLKV